MLVEIPEDVYNHLQKIADETQQPLEQIVANRLKSAFYELPLDEQAELNALHQLSDDTLWTIAAEQMPDSVQARAHELMDRNSRGLITDEEYAELQKLVERADRLMVRKAEAAGILKERGYTITQQDFKPK